MTALLPDRRDRHPEARSAVPAKPSRRVRLGRRAGRVAELASRASGRGAGGVIGGRVLLALAPAAPQELSAGRDLLLVSGTNGKTTTTAMLAACLRHSGTVGSNTDGANTPAGLVRALADGDATRMVLEVDEGWLPWALARTRPGTVLLLNLTRDQLHRHHEVARLAQLWRTALAGVDHVVANADDPAVVLAALAARSQTWVAPGSRWVEDSTACPRCGGACTRTGADWACACGLRRPDPHWVLDGDDLVGRGVRIPLGLGLPGHANRANAAMAVAAATRTGLQPAEAVAALAGLTSVAGRYAVVSTRHHHARLLLAKNPAGWYEALDMVAGSRDPLVLAFNADGVDGRDPSWLYDVPFDAIAGRRVAVTGRRATDMLVRLEMAGLTDVRRADDVLAAVRLLPPGDVQVLANYTAFQDARRSLARAR